MAAVAAAVAAVATVAVVAGAAPVAFSSSPCVYGGMDAVAAPSNGDEM